VGTGKHAIPQGSLLVHMLFLIYIHLSNHHQYQYTDLMLQMTEYRVSRTKVTIFRTAIMALFHSLTEGLKTFTSDVAKQIP